MFRALKYGIIGYLFGSILSAQIFGHLILQKDIFSETRDKNPGTANAFMQGGLLCGILTLCFDLAKGFFPVYLYIHAAPGPGMPESGLAFVMLMPVIGHILPVFFHFHGGKGIATTFGVFMGLFPHVLPLCLFIFFFLFFSLILRVTPHYSRTIWSYTATLIGLLIAGMDPHILLGASLITLAVLIRLHISNEEREECKVRLLWKH